MLVFALPLLVASVLSGASFWFLEDRVAGTFGYGPVVATVD